MIQYTRKVMKMSMKQSEVKVGMRFGHLVTTGPSYVEGKVRKIPCRCDCGKEYVVRVDHLLDHDDPSCGCVVPAKVAALHTKHGEWTTKLWGHWSAMRRRCNTASTGNFAIYGGRGIGVCDEWKDYLAFREWALTHGYDDSLSLDRIDVNGDYCPENCRWVTAKEQARNRRNTIYVEFRGERVPPSQLSEEYGADPDLVYARVVRQGWNVEKALTTPKRRVSR